MKHGHGRKEVAIEGARPETGAGHFPITVTTGETSVRGDRDGLC